MSFYSDTFWAATKKVLKIALIIIGGLILLYLGLMTGIAQ